MKNMLRKNDKGITLISLVVMIIIILILATVGTNTGINVIRESKYHRAVSEMKTMQTKINEMYAEYKGGDDSIVTLGSNIDDVPSSLKSKAETAIRSVDGNLNHEYDYKYYSSDDIKNTLDLDGVEGDYLVNIKNRNVILIEGTKSDGKTYYSLSQIETEQFNVEYINPSISLSKNGGTYYYSDEEPLDIKVTLNLIDEPYDTNLKLEYKWSNDKDNEPTEDWKEYTTEIKADKEDFLEDGTYYLWTKISNLDNGKELNVDVSKAFIVKEIVNDKVEYTVKYKLANLEGNDYITKETIKLNGKKGSQVTPEVKTYTGFKSPAAQTVTIEDDTEVTYEYERNRYQYTLILSNGITLLDSTPSSSENGYPYEQPITLNATANEGYTFIRWKIGEETLSTQAEYTFNMPARDITVTAETSENEYIITLNPGDNVTTNGTTTLYEKYNSGYSLTSGGSTTSTITAPTKTGFTFGGYYTEQNGGGTQIVDGSGNIVGSNTVITANTTLHAKWTASEYTVTFDANGGTGTMSNQEFTYGVAQNLTENTYVRDGYKLYKWNTEADGSGTYYDDKASISINENMTLYAIWDTAWQDDYEYELNENDKLIKLNNYIGTATDIVLPKIAIEKGVQYKTLLRYNGETSVYSNTTVKNLSFEDGYEFYTSSGSIFRNCPNLISIDLSNVDMSKVTSANQMFSTCTSLTNINLDGVNTSNISNMAYIFYKCSSLTALDLSSFDTTSAKYMQGMFDGCEKLTSLNLETFTTTQVTNMSHMFESCKALTNLNLSSFRTNNVENMEYMFMGCNQLQSVDLSQFNTNKVNNMHYMFYGCWTIDSLNLSSFNTTSVTDMGDMFYECRNLRTLNLSNFDTSSVQDIHGMFYDCRNLETLNLSSFNTSNATDMRYMFYGCKKLSNIDLSSFNTSNATDMRYMFYGCKKLSNIDLSGFITNKVTKMSQMFEECDALESIDVSSFNTSKVTNMDYMFANNDSLVTIYASTDFTQTSLTDGSNMFLNSPKLEGGNGTVWNYMYITATDRAYIDSEEHPGYFTNKNARTVNFDANGGTVSPTKKQVIVNEAYGELPTPTKEGYTFKGWTLENNPGDNPTYITASSSVNNASNHTLYALWEINKYDVVFRKNEVQYELPDEYRELEYIEGTGTQWIDTNCALWNDPNWKIENKFEISEHYDYNNMFALSNNSSLDNEAWIASDKNYYVRFTDTGKASIGTFDINTPYTVTFDNTGSNLLVYINGKQEKVLTRANTLLSGSVSYAHRQSGGYLKGKTYYLKMWSNGELVRYFIPCYSINDDEAGLYDVIGNVFYPSGSSDQYVKDKFVKGVDFTEAQQFTYFTSQNLKTNTFTREGYTFSGWNTKPDGSGTSYSDGENVNNLTEKNNGTFNLYAQWTPNQYDIVFNKNKTLPSEYQELEYIEGTGTQYINTNYKLWKTANWKIENKFEVNEHYNYNNMFGVTGVTDTNNEMWIDNTKNYYIRIGGINPKVSVGIIDANKPYTITYDNTSANFIAYVNGIFTKSLNKANTNKDFNLLYGHRDGANYLKGKTYYLKLWSDGELVRDFIPCNRISDDKAGLYDVVGKTFYPSASSDEFVKGPVVTSTTDGTMQNQHFTYGTSQNLTLNSYTREGFTFEGWRDDNGNLYADGQAINNLTTENGGTVNLYAQWTDGEPIVINSSQQSGQSSNTLGRQFAENTQKGNNNTKIILIISIVVLITIIVGIYMKKKKKK